MKKESVIEHLKKVLKSVEELEDNVDVRVYVHINRERSETDIELGGTKQTF